MYLLIAVGYALLLLLTGLIRGGRTTEKFFFADRKLGQSKMNLSIQVEAALRVWTLRSRYKGIKPLK